MSKYLVPRFIENPQIPSVFFFISFYKAVGFSDCVVVRKIFRIIFVFENKKRTL